MRHLAVDMEMLTMALESHDLESPWVLDLDSGDVIPVVSPMICGDSTTVDEVERNPSRYLHIEPIPSHESFRIMEAFAAQLSPGAARTSLLEALERRHPFRQFKAVLLAFPEVRERWFRYHDLCLNGIAEEWLKVNDVKSSPRPLPPGQKRPEGAPQGL